MPRKKPKHPTKRATIPRKIKAELKVNGRPKLVWRKTDFIGFQRMCRDQCTMEEIAAYMGVCRETLSQRVKEYYGENFEDVYKRLRLAGNVYLRRLQYKRAAAGNGDSTMLKFIGKNQLGQRENFAEETPGVPIGTGEARVMMLPAYAPKMPAPPLSPEEIAAAEAKAKAQEPQP